MTAETEHQTRVVSQRSATARTAAQFATLASPVGRMLAAVGGTWSRLWFTPASTMPLELSRIGIGALLIVQYGLVSPYLLEFFSDAGWMPRKVLSEFIEQPWTDPRFVQSIFFYFTEPWQFIAFHVFFLLCCLAFMLGWRTSWVKWVVLFGKISYDYRNPAFMYGADIIIGCMLFVMCFAPIGRALSLDRVRAVRAAKRRNLPTVLPPYSSAMAGACTRLIQLQMAILFFYSATSKLKYEEWWSGDALWLVFTMADYFHPFITGLIAQHYWLSAVGTYATILIEIAYPFLIWQQRTRPYMLAAALFLHFMFALLMSLIFFALAMTMGHITFVRPEWLHRLGAWWKHRIGAMEMVYDGRCGFCVRSMAWLLAFDGLQQIGIRDFRTNPCAVVTDVQLEKALYLVLPDGRALPGFEAYRHVVARVPGLWWLAPFFYVPVLSRLFGHPIYNWVAANRSRLSAVRLSLFPRAAERL
jgi:predicted DCC family thiol-disulfide oxidoreductase YuxK